MQCTGSPSMRVFPRRRSSPQLTAFALLAACLIKGQLASWVPKQHKHIKGRCHSITQLSGGFVNIEWCFPLARITDIALQVELMRDNELVPVRLLSASQLSEQFKVDI